MRNLHNIEKSQFRRREYIGYAQGAVWHICKPGHYWEALNAETCAMEFAPTLTALSKKLAKLDQ